MLYLPLARTVHQASGLNFHLHVNQPTQSLKPTFSFTLKVFLLHNGACHMQASMPQTGKTLCMSQPSHAGIPTPEMSHMYQYYAIQNHFNN